MRMHCHGNVHRYLIEKKRGRCTHKLQTTIQYFNKWTNRFNENNKQFFFYSGRKESSCKKLRQRFLCSLQGFSESKKKKKEEKYLFPAVKDEYYLVKKWSSEYFRCTRGKSTGPKSD